MGHIFLKQTILLDNLWRDIIKTRANKKCERCSRTEELHSHHIIKRTYWPTRWDLDNGICLCAICHKIAHDNEEIFKLWVAKKRPLNQLEKKKHSLVKLDPYLIETLLTDILRSYP